jgi:hypothetical protein
VGTLLIRIRATVALDVQSTSIRRGWRLVELTADERASAVTLSRESCSFCDLGGQKVIGASPARHVCAKWDSADRQTV